MNIKHVLIAFVAILSVNTAISQEKKFKMHTVAFYNLENLFDTKDDPAINDEEYTPAKGWTEEKYKKKLLNLDRVISEIGTNEQHKNAPTLIGVCEIENRGVLEDLIKQPKLINHDYGIVHFDSPDFRGIDVGFLYQKKHFTVISKAQIPLYIYKDEEVKSEKSKKETPKEEESKEVDEDSYKKVVKGGRVYTRDQLLVSGYLDGEEMHFIVNHWPSRSGGEKKSSRFREEAAALNKKIIDSLQKINPNAKVITMGDLNDGSYNKSVKEVLGAKRKKEEVGPLGIYNPFEEMYKNGHATLFWRDSGDIFDQIMFTQPLIREGYSTFKYWKAGIYNKSYMIQTTGQYKGYPLRNSPSEPGFSDHFPVYIYLIKEFK